MSICIKEALKSFGLQWNLNFALLDIEFVVFSRILEFRIQIY